MAKSSEVRFAARGLLSAVLFAGGVAVAVAAGALPVCASDFDVVIHEIQYNPWIETDDEFVEVYNRGGIAVDLSGWAFVEGLTFLVPPGTILEPKQILVISPNPAHTRSRYGLTNVAGAYSGRLDNDGEILSLVNSRGDVISRVHYRDGGAWPSSPDGLGTSLELVDLYADPDNPRSWRASLDIDGTPGRANSAAVDAGPSPQEMVLVSESDVWRYRKGTGPYPAAWRNVGFVPDASWLSGATGIGYGDGDDATELTDMENGYSSFAARKTLQLTPTQLDALGDVSFSIDYDDAFVAYVNGVEIGRGNLGSPAGSPVPFDATAAGTHEAGQPETFSVPAALFAVGENVLAVQVHNATLDSSDASFIPRLFSLPLPASQPGGENLAQVVINEVKPAEAAGGGYVEFQNRTDAAFAVGGFVIADSNGHRFTVAGGTTIAPRGRVVFTHVQLGFSPSLTDVTYVLLDDDGLTYVDGLNPRPGRVGENGFSFGRYPDGDDDTFVMAAPSAGAANTLSLPSAVLVNEVYFHPPYVAPNGTCTADCSDLEQWIELHNSSGAPVDLSGWSLTKGVEFPFAAGSLIGAGGFLVVASDRDRFLALHPGVPAARVVGNWTRDLAHDSDTINLRDALGNLVDHVRYGDGGPRNDEEPADGVDDRTIASSDWPGTADGSGRTLELIHPAMDNRLGGAWAAGSVGGTPGAANSVFSATPFPAVGEVGHSPAVPGPAESVLVTARASGAGSAVSVVRALWRVDGGGASGGVVLVDDGTAGDAFAGDGVYSGRLPAQSDRAVVAFQVEAVLVNGRRTLVPRPPEAPPYAGFSGPYFLYQVLAGSPPANGNVDYYVVMTQADLAQLGSRPLESDVLLHATFIDNSPSGTRSVRHLSAIRYRGSTTRDLDPKSYRVIFPAERDFEGVKHINLNATVIENDLLAADLFRRAGMPYPEERTVNLTFQGTVNPRYLRKERIDEDFLSRYFGGGSDDGNLYRALDPNDGMFPFQGDLSYLGPDPDSYLPYYSKETNEEESSYAEIVELTAAFDPVETPDSGFADRVESLADANQWARFFAVQSCLSNIDGAIQSITGEDYFLYRVPATSSRLDAGKWILVPWDLEETFANEGEALFRPSIVAIQRFLTHPRFAPLYYCHLMNLRFGAFSRLEIRQRFRLINSLFGFGTIDGLDSYMTARIGFIDENVPMELSSGTGSVPGTPLVASGEVWSYFKGTAEPSGGSLAWTAVNFADGSWLQGPTGIGFGDGDDATVLDDMVGNYTTVYARRRFQIVNPAAIAGLQLRVDYDDAFVAYLNGVEVARSGVSGNAGDPVPFGATASAAHEAGTAEVFDLAAHVGSLIAGTNVLAVQGFNSALTSGDLSLRPELLTGASGAGGLGCGRVLFATEGVLGLTGQANACLTARVEINGQAAGYDPFLATWDGSVALAPGDNLVLVEAFDALGVSIETLPLQVRRVSGFTSVAGNLAGNVTWTPAGGPYLLTNNVTVPAGSTLTVQAGTVILGRQGASIIVRGRIRAEGTAPAPILLRAASCASRWGGIAMDGTGTGAGDPEHILRYVDIEFADQPSGFAGCVAPVNAKLLVDHATLRHLTANALDGTNARVEVRDSLFESVHEGIHCTSSTVIVLDSTFRRLVGDKDAIDFDLNGTERSRIERCLVVDSSDDGVDLADTTVDIRDNVFINVQDKALSLEGNGPLGPPTVTGNVLINCGTAIALKNGVTISVGHNNTLVGNQEGVNLFAKAGASDGGHGAFDSMIIWNNAEDVKLDALSTVSFSFSDISDAVWPGQGNVSSDPRFVDPLRGDVSLQATSPCIGTGLNGIDMGAIPYGGALQDFIRGDTDVNGIVNLTDAVRILDHLFRAGPSPSCRDRMDANDDGGVDVSDPVYELLFLFGGGTAPPAPYPAAGLDPTADSLPCV